MAFWRRKKKIDPEVGQVFEKMNMTLFPGGKAQIESEAATLAKVLGSRISGGSARRMLVHAKSLALISSQSATTDGEVVRRLTTMLQRKYGLSEMDAKGAGRLVFDTLVKQLASSEQSSSGRWNNMTKDEALLVARLMAYRVARHQGRNSDRNREIYGVDPSTYIMTVMSETLVGDRGNKIETREEAAHLAFRMTGMLVAYHLEAQKDGGESGIGEQQLETFLNNELEITLSLIRNGNSGKGYSKYDPGEARAAAEMQVPFEIALALGERGLLRDDPEPTPGRSELIRRITGR